MARPRPSLLGNRLLRVMRRLRLGKDRERLTDLWQEQVARGEALTRLTQSADWPYWLALLESVQQDADRPLRDLRSTDAHRLIAAAQWCAVEALRRELTQAIARGKAAQTSLAKVEETTTIR